MNLRHTLEYSENSLTAIYINFIPNNNKIFTCFSDDTIHIWCQNDMSPVKQFSLFKNFNQFLKKNKCENIKIYENDNKKFIGLNENFKCGRVYNACFTNNGEYVCLCTIDNFLIIMNTKNWQIWKILHLIDINKINEINFISQINYEISKYLCIILDNGDVILINLDNINMKTIIRKNDGYKIGLNNDNTSIFGIILKSGEIIISNIDFHLSHLESFQRNLEYHRDDRQNNDVLLEKLFSEVSGLLII